MLGICTIIGICMNVTVMVLFTKSRLIRTRITYLFRSLAVSDGIMALVGGSMFVINCFHHRWIFGHEGRNCDISSPIENLLKTPNSDKNNTLYKSCLIL